jgi:hypothetical protein
MTDGKRRYPASLDEFWDRLNARKLEPDLHRALRERAGRETGAVTRLGDAETVRSVVEALLPGSAVPASVIAEFVDAHFDQQLGRGDERTGIMPRAELVPAGFAALEQAAAAPFHTLAADVRHSLLVDAESGKLAGPPGFDSATWFKRLRDIVLLAFASDPRGMLQMGYPGPSYQPGYLWLAWDAPAARRNRRAGYRKF